MFNFFGKKQQSEVRVLTVEQPIPKKQYPQVVHDIHNEFYIAGDKILDEAKSLLTQLEKTDIAKGKRLAALGFGKTREAVVAIEAENKLATTKEIADLVMYYKVKYPNNKFITEEQVKAICEKYGLVCGETTMYKGFVPVDKLNDIERFSIKKEDVFFKKYSKDIGYRNIGEILDDGGINARDYTSIFSLVEMPDSFKICAPLSDMDIPDTKQVVGYKIEDKKIPDPVVLHPCRGGYLIVCAWGDEASDEIVVNQAMN